MSTKKKKKDEDTGASHPPRFIIGNDNGVTGSIAVISVETGDLVLYKPTPVVKQLSYTKAAKWMNFLDVEKYIDILEPYALNARLFMERPMINPTRWVASASALCCWTLQRYALQTLAESHGLRVEYIDSKQWQKVMLPEGLTTAPVLKQASLDVGNRLFPKQKFKKDADAALIAEWARQTKR